MGGSDDGCLLTTYNNAEKTYHETTTLSTTQHTTTTNKYKLHYTTTIADIPASTNQTDNSIGTHSNKTTLSKSLKKSKGKKNLVTKTRKMLGKKIKIINRNGNNGNKTDKMNNNKSDVSIGPSIGNAGIKNSTNNAKYIEKKKNKNDSNLNNSNSIELVEKKTFQIDAKISPINITVSGANTSHVEPTKRGTMSF